MKSKANILYAMLKELHALKAKLHHVERLLSEARL